MNVLLFVTSLLMVMATLTYAKLQTYRSFSLIQTKFNHYMEEEERTFINQVTQDNYEQAPRVAKKNKNTSDNRGKQSDPAPQPSPSKKKSTGKLSLALFLDAKKKNNYSKEFALFNALAHKLISLLFKEHPFYKQMEEKHPDLINQFLASLAVADQLPPAQKPRQAKDLANLELGDEDLDRLAYYLFQDTANPKQTSLAQISINKPSSNKLSSSQLKINAKNFSANFPTQLTSADTLEEEEEAIDSENTPDLYSPEGYYSLLNYVTLADATHVRVFLANRLLLLAIFEDPVVVESILSTRHELYRKLLSHVQPLTNQEASEIFEKAFIDRSDPTLRELLDFSITKTNPKKYD